MGIWSSSKAYEGGEAVSQKRAHFCQGAKENKKIKRDSFQSTIVGH